MKMALHKNQEISRTGAKVKAANWLATNFTVKSNNLDIDKVDIGAVVDARDDQEDMIDSHDGTSSQDVDEVEVGGVVKACTFKKP